MLQSDPIEERQIVFNWARPMSMADEEWRALKKKVKTSWAFLWQTLFEWRILGAFEVLLIEAAPSPPFAGGSPAARITVTLEAPGLTDDLLDLL